MAGASGALQLRMNRRAGGLPDGYSVAARARRIWWTVGTAVYQIAFARVISSQNRCAENRTRVYFGGCQPRIYGSDCGADSPGSEQCDHVLGAVVAVEGDGVGAVDPGVFEVACERASQLTQLPVGQPRAAVGHSDRNPVWRAADAVLDELGYARMAHRGLATGHGRPPQLFALVRDRQTPGAALTASLADRSAKRSAGGAHGGQYRADPGRLQNASAARGCAALASSADQTPSAWHAS